MFQRKTFKIRVDAFPFIADPQNEWPGWPRSQGKGVKAQIDPSLSTRRWPPETKIVGIRSTSGQVKSIVKKKILVGTDHHFVRELGELFGELFIEKLLN